MAESPWIYCTRISFSSFEDQPFSGCTSWRSDSLTTFFLSSHSSVKVKSQTSETCTSLLHQQKGDGRPPGLYVNSLWMSRHPSLLRTSTWCKTQRLSGLRLEKTFPVHWAETLTTRPPSLWLHCLFPPYIDFHTQFLNLLTLQRFLCLWNILSVVLQSLCAISFVSQSEPSR